MADTLSSQVTLVICLDTEVSLNLPTTVSQFDFLRNADNKEQLIEALMGILEDEGLHVKQLSQCQCSTFAVFTAAQLAQEHQGHPVVVVGKDIDIFVMLIAHASPCINICCVAVSLKP